MGCFKPSLLSFPRLEGCGLVWDAAEDQELGSSLPCWEKGESLPGGGRGLVMLSSAGGCSMGSPELFFGCFRSPFSAPVEAEGVSSVPAVQKEISIEGKRVPWLEQSPCACPAPAQTFHWP